MVCDEISGALLPAKSNISSLASALMDNAKSDAVYAVLFNAFTVKSIIVLSAF